MTEPPSRLLVVKPMRDIINNSNPLDIKQVINMACIQWFMPSMKQNDSNVIDIVYACISQFGYLTFNLTQCVVFLKGQCRQEVICNCNLITNFIIPRGHNKSGAVF